MRPMVYDATALQSAADGHSLNETFGPCVRVERIDRLRMTSACESAPTVSMRSATSSLPTVQANRTCHLTNPASCVSIISKYLFR